jgi:hypothetical protein
MPSDVRQQDIDFLQSAAKPQSVLLLMPASPVQRLVEATKVN